MSEGVGGTPGRSPMSGEAPVRNLKEALAVWFGAFLPQFVRIARLLADQAWLRAGAAPARRGAGPDDGGEPALRHADLAAT